MNILITGATRGIGLCMSYEFIKRGHKVFGVGRSWENDSQKDNNMLIPIKADITKEEERIKIFKYLKGKNIEIDILVNNAGVGSIGEFQNINFYETEKMINLNIIALTHMTRLFLENLKNRKDIEDKKNKKDIGIINISSTAAFQSGGAYASVYYATKSYVKSFSLGLFEELKDKNIRVMCLCPGPVKTDFEGMKNIKKSFYIMTPEDVAKIAISDYFKNKNISVVGFLNKIFVFISRFIPRNIELLIIKKIQK